MGEWVRVTETGRDVKRLNLNESISQTEREAGMVSRRTAITLIRIKSNLATTSN